jgi:membrane associated rhomboid family serine protease
MHNSQMKPLVRDGVLFCPHCDIRLKVVEHGARCGVCLTQFSAKEIFNTQLEQMTPKERSEYYETKARATLKAKEDSLGDVELVPLHSLPKWKKLLLLFGIPHEEESYAVSIFPFVSISFIVICVVSFLMTSQTESTLTLDPKHLWRWGGLNFLTYSFMHGDFLHLFGNIIFMWPFMDNVEEHLGHIKTLVLLIISAIVSAATHLIGDKSDLPLVGASGICFAMAVLYCFRYPKNRFIISIPFVGMFIPTTGIRFRARTLILYYIALELLGVFEQRAALTNVSHFGHLGGAITGLVFYFLTMETKDAV